MRPRHSTNATREAAESALMMNRQHRKGPGTVLTSGMNFNSRSVRFSPESCSKSGAFCTASLEPPPNVYWWFALTPISARETFNQGPRRRKFSWINVSASRYVRKHFWVCFESAQWLIDFHFDLFLLAFAEKRFRQKTRFAGFFFLLPPST